MKPPVFICGIEPDPRDPSAIIQAQADRIEDLEEQVRLGCHVVGAAHSKCPACKEINKLRNRIKELEARQ